MLFWYLQHRTRGWLCHLVGPVWTTVSVADTKDELCPSKSSYCPGKSKINLSQDLLFLASSMALHSADLVVQQDRLWCHEWGTHSLLHLFLSPHICKPCKRYHPLMGLWTSPHCLWLSFLWGLDTDLRQHQEKLARKNVTSTASCFESPFHYCFAIPSPSQS
jgi:hypothetical protein